MSTPPYLLTSGGRPVSCLFDLLKELATEALPLRVYGDIEFQLNRLPDGWVITLVNNKGVVKVLVAPGDRSGPKGPGANRRPAGRCHRLRVDHGRRPADRDSRGRDPR